IDIDAKENTEVLASFGGTVKECGEDKELGKYILLDHGQGIETKYAHLNKIKVKKGEEVKKGKDIAESGNTGKSTGAHLHFEIIYMGENKNPQDYFSNIKE
ncbi:M23 family peptidase, partial [Clostridium botulinum]